jgi:transcriptional regulator with XRE-family HTH domain
MINRRSLTDDELIMSKNLRRIWDKKKDKLGLTQEKAGYQFGCTQGAIGHYLNGKIPLNLRAQLKFAQILQVNATDINPRVDFLIGNLSELSQDAINVAHSYDQLPPHFQSEIKEFIESNLKWARKRSVPKLVLHSRRQED